MIDGLECLDVVQWGFGVVWFEELVIVVLVYIRLV